MKHVLLPTGADPVPQANALAGRGWRPRHGFSAPDEPWDLAAQRHLAVGAISTAEEAAAALLLAVRGALLVVTIDGEQPWAEAFRADLNRLSGTAAPAASGRPIPLSTEQRQLFDLLAQGRSIAAAAEELFVSLRTANRRIAEARKALGAGTTSEAVVAYMRLLDS